MQKMGNHFKRKEGLGGLKKEGGGDFYFFSKREGCKG